MSSTIPSITISKMMTFSNAGVPERELFEISAVIDTPDEITPLGQIRFEDLSDLVHLYNILGTYILINGLDNTDEVDRGQDDGDHEEDDGYDGD